MKDQDFRTAVLSPDANDQMVKDWLVENNFADLAECTSSSSDYNSRDNSYLAEPTTSCSTSGDVSSGCVPGELISIKKIVKKWLHLFIYFCTYYSFL